MTTFVQHYCAEEPACIDDATGYAHRFNVEYTASPHKHGEPVNLVQLTCDYPKYPRTDDYAKERGITVGGTFGIICDRCNGTARSTKRAFRGRTGKTACETICEKATSANCSCQCGGVNHGIRA